MVDSLDLIIAKEKEFDPLWKRMDEDGELIYNVNFILRDWDGRPVKRVYSVTIPNAALFYAKMVSLISRVSRLPIITDPQDKMTDDSKANIINFLKDMDFEIDTLLNNKDELDAFTTHTGYFCGRGWSAEQVLLRMDDGKLITDVRQLDPRWLTYATGMEGVTWFNYDMVRSSVDIEAEYNRTVPNDEGVISDRWDDKTEKIYISSGLGSAREQIAEKKNPYGYPPIVIQAVPFGAGLLKEKDAIKRKGESIFYPHRDMFKEVNFMASILKTQSFDDLRPALQSPGDKTGEPPKEYPASQSNTATDEPILLVPRRDMTNAMRNYLGIINSMIQRAGLSNLDEGTITFPLAAVAIAKMLAQKQSLTMPRLAALELLYRARTRMIIKQIMTMGGSFKIGEEGRERTYKASELEGTYTVGWSYFTPSLEDDAAKSAIADSQRGLLPDRAIRRDTLQRENPEQDENWLEVEEAKRKEPLITDLERIYSLIDEDTDESNVEAWILFNKLTTILKQRTTTGVAEPQAPPPLRPTQQLPVFAQGGGGGVPGGVQPADQGVQG